MRSSMFNKHPMLEKIEAPDSDSEFSHKAGGRASQFSVRHKNDKAFKSQASPTDDNLRSQSSRKLQPI